jgi:hypothetical protein
MTASSARATLASCAGLLAGPLLWSVNTEAGQILPYADCRSSIHFAAILSLISVALALGSGWVSWRARTAGPVAWSERTLRFVAVLSCLTALIFALALLLQGAAGLVLTGCER